MTNFSFKARNEIKGKLKSEDYELVIIGGGITGAGVAIQAAASGIKTALIEMQDFSEGTSSRSTKLVHGGIRYLKQFDIEVVADTVTERAVVQQIAPHIPQPDPMLMPLYDEEGVTFNPFRLQVAMDLYDSLAGVKDSKFANKMLTREEVIDLQPGIMQEGLLCGGLYLDFNNNDSRLTIENIKQAQTDGADILSHVKATGFDYTDGKISAVQVEDTLTGEEFAIKTQLVINTTGPWSDTIREMDEAVDYPTQMRPTKGVHFVIDNSKLKVGQPTYFDTGEQDGRMVFVIPRENKTYFGTTDTDYDGDFENPVATKEDLDYLLTVVNRRFPDANISLDDIETSWAGLRPLIDGNNASDYNGGDSGRLSNQTFDQLANAFNQYNNGQTDRDTVEDLLADVQSNTSERGDGSPSSVSRGSDLSVGESGLITLAGGKITDYRKMAEGALKAIIARLQELTGKNYTLVKSKTYPVSGGQFDPTRVEEAIDTFANLGVSRGLKYSEAKRLAKVYGSNMTNVLRYLPDAEAYAEKYDLPVAIALGLVYALEEEMVYSPLDFFERRTTFLLFQFDRMLAIKDAVSKIIAEHLDLSDDEVAKQADELAAQIKETSLADLKN